ncbi:MAG: TonB-dependent receptor [Alphaproteobacteria bacterium]
MVLSAPAQAQDDGGPEAAAGGVDVITVTAQKKAESLLDVPISVTAFDTESLDALQIDTFSDLQFNTPNVSFTKGNFSGSNFQIRGIGSTLVAASSDTGVGIHMNEVYLNSARIFELEYFDVERVEILRGPQGTLHGRNATGGSVNMVTVRPVMDEYGISLEGQYGNFDHKKFKGWVNIPIVRDKIAFRAAGIWLDRDGYTENIFTGNDLDGRNNYAFRGSLRLQPTETTTIDVIASHFNEDSNRLRSQKQMCHRDDSAVLGCLPDKLAFENVNGNGTLGGLLVTDLVLGPLGLEPFFGPGGLDGIENPADLRKVNLDFEPNYHADETFLMGRLDQLLFDGDITFTLLAAHQSTSVFSQQDYNMVISDPATVPALLPFVLPNTFNAFYSDGLFPISDIDVGTNTGLIGGNILRKSNLLESYDQSTGDSDQTSVEARIQSNFDGPLNFLLAGYYLTYDSEFDYYVVASTLDYFSVVGGGLTFGDGAAFAPPYFNSETDQYTLDSWAAFGEVRYDVLPDLELIGGLRYTVDEKFIRDRQVLFNTVAPIGTTDLEPFLQLVDADAGTPGVQPFREDTVEFSEITGRAVVNWKPDLGFTDTTLFYGSYSRGYKAGGFNPPFDPALFPNTAETFDPEFINAYEIGMKHTLLDNTLQATMSAFYYDYGGLQVSKIVNRTSFNENIDATIWGVEGEFLYAPDDRWLFNTSFSYLNTEIGEAFSVDTRDPTGGRSDVLLVKSIFDASNCVIEKQVAAAPDPTLAAFGIIPPPSNTDGISAPTGFSDCDALAAALNPALPGDPDPNPFYELTDGVQQNLEGNRLQNSPEWTINAGVQYTYPFANGMTLTGRFDYYWQAHMFARIFNQPIDRIDSWDVMNAQLTLNGVDERWFLRFFIQNIEDEDNVTGQFVSDPSSGLFTNMFLLEPRLYGVTAGVRF